LIFTLIQTKAAEASGNQAGTTKKGDLSGVPWAFLGEYDEGKIYPHDTM
jgi:hypothetical protein